MMPSNPLLLPPPRSPKRVVVKSRYEVGWRGMTCLELEPSGGRKARKEDEMLEVNKYYRCLSCGRTYRCRVVGNPASACGHPLQAQQEITKSEYSQIRMSCYRNQDRMQKQNKAAREGAEIYHISVADKDDAISIFGKVVGLSKEQVIRLFTQIGWTMYYRRQGKVRRKAQDGSISGEEKENTPPEVDDLDFFDELETVVAVARGIPHSFRMDMHPKFKEYSYFFSLAIYQFAYCYPHVNYCSQDGLRWLFDGLQGILEAEGRKESVLLEAEEILKKQRESES